MDLARSVKNQVKDAANSVKNEVKDAAKKTKNFVKTHVVEPILEFSGLLEGAKRRKGQVEEFFNDIGGDSENLHSLSQLLADNLYCERSDSVHIVDISSKRKLNGRSASGPTAFAEPRASTPTERLTDKLKKVAGNSIFARCANREVCVWYS